MAKEKILIVDDEKKILGEIEEFLTLEGYEVSVADNGAEGLRVFKEVQPDIVFMDIKMPGMDGVETFRYMKKARPETKVIIITGLTDEKTIDRAMGVDKNAIEGFIPKPFGFSEIQQCLERLKAGDKDSAFQFTQAQLSALNKVGKTGAGNASLSFSQLLGKKIELSMQKVAIIPWSEAALAEGTTPMAGMMHKLLGRINGRLIVLFPWQSALDLVHLGLAPAKTGKMKQFDEKNGAILKSAGMVLSGAYLNAVNELTRLTTQPSLPELIFEPKEVIFKSLNEELGRATEYLFIIQTEFTIVDTDIKGWFLLMPDTDSLKQILKNLGALA